MTFAEFASDPRTVDAGARNLEVIGEAVKTPADRVERTSSGGRLAKNRRPPRLIYAYFGIDVEILWDIVMNKVPTLADTVAAMRPTGPPKP